MIFFCKGCVFLCVCFSFTILFDAKQYLYHTMEHSGLSLKFCYNTTSVTKNFFCLEVGGCCRDGV